MGDSEWFDLYLYQVPHSDDLVKIPHLNRNDAEQYASYWFEMNDLHDYMLVTEGSTPWSEPVPIITVASPDWIEQQYELLNKG